MQQVDASVEEHSCSHEQRCRLERMHHFCCTARIPVPLAPSLMQSLRPIHIFNKPAQLRSHDLNQYEGVGKYANK